MVARGAPPRLARSLAEYAERDGEGDLTRSTVTCRRWYGIRPRAKVARGCTCTFGPKKTRCEYPRNVGARAQRAPAALRLITTLLLASRATHTRSTHVTRVTHHQSRAPTTTCNTHNSLYTLACISCTTFPTCPTTPTTRPRSCRTRPRPQLHTLARPPPPPATLPSTQRGVTAKSSCNPIAICLAAFPTHSTAPRPPPRPPSGSTRPPMPRAPRPPPKTGPPTHTHPPFPFLHCISPTMALPHTCYPTCHRALPRASATIEPAACQPIPHLSHPLFAETWHLIRLRPCKHSTIHRPSIDHLSAIHRPSIGHPSTIHRPSIGHPSAIHRPSIGHPSEPPSIHALHGTQTRICSTAVSALRSDSIHIAWQSLTPYGGRGEGRPRPPPSGGRAKTSAVIPIPERKMRHQSVRGGGSALLDYVCWEFRGGR